MSNTEMTPGQHHAATVVPAHRATFGEMAHYPYDYVWCQAAAYAPCCCQWFGSVGETRPDRCTVHGDPVNREWRTMLSRYQYLSAKNRIT